MKDENLTTYKTHQICESKCTVHNFSHACNEWRTDTFQIYSSMSPELETCHQHNKKNHSHVDILL